MDIGTTYGLPSDIGTLRDGSLCIKVILIFSNLNLSLGNIREIIHFFSI